MRAVWSRAARGVRQHAADRRAVRRRVHRGRQPDAAVPGARRARPRSPGWSRRSSAGSRTRFPGGVPDDAPHAGRATRSASSCQMGFPGYFLVVADLVRYAKENGIRVGPGRGSAAGAMIAVRAGHHRARPDQARAAVRAVPQPRAHLDARHRHGLRRAPARRHDPLRHREVRRGAGRADHHLRHDQGQGGDQGRRPGPRLPVRHGRPDHQGDAAAGDGQGHLARPASSTRPTPRYAEAGEFRALYDADPDVKRVVDTATRARGPQAPVGRARRRRHPVPRAAARRHPDPAPRAGRRDHHPVRHGRVRGARPAQDGLPRPAQPHRPRRLPRATSTTNRGETVVLEDARRSTTRRPTSCSRRGDTLGVFQLDGGPMRALLRSMQPDNFEDISAVARALPARARWAPTRTTTTPTARTAASRSTPIHPELAEPLAEILDDTYGLIVYQEQVMAIAQKLAGYSPRQGRPAAPRDGQEEEGDPRQGVRPVHARACGPTATPTRAIKTLWDILVPFSDYAFNKAHTRRATGWCRTGPPTSRRTTRPSTWPRCSPSVRDDKDKSALYLQRVPADGHQGAAARRQRVRRRLHPARHRHPVRAVGDPQRRRATSSSRSSRPAGPRAASPTSTTSSRKVDAVGLQQAHRRVADQGRRVRLARPHPQGPASPIHEQAIDAVRRHQAGRGDRPVRPVRRRSTTDADAGARARRSTIPVGEWDKTIAAGVRARDARALRLRPPAVRRRARAGRGSADCSIAALTADERGRRRDRHRRRPGHRRCSARSPSRATRGRSPRSRTSRASIDVMVFPQTYQLVSHPARRGRRRRGPRPARQARGRRPSSSPWRSPSPTCPTGRAGRCVITLPAARCIPPVVDRLKEVLADATRASTEVHLQLRRRPRAPRSCGSTTGSGSRPSPALYGDLKALLGPGSVG